MSSFGSLPGAAPPRSLVATQDGKSIAERVADSQKRLKGAYGDATVDAAQTCKAQPADHTHYAGKCRQCSDANIVPVPTHSLASTQESKDEAKLLFNDVMANGVGGQPAQLLANKGSMFGVLIAVDNQGKTHVLKAFSGNYAGTGMFDAPGWCPPVPAVNAPQQLQLEQAFTAAEQNANAFATQIEDDMENVAEKQEKVTRLTDLINQPPAAVPGHLNAAAAANMLAAQAKRKLGRQNELVAAQAELDAANAEFLANQHMSAAQAAAQQAQLKTAVNAASAALLQDYAANRVIPPSNGAAPRNFLNACYAETPAGAFDANAAQDIALHGQTGWCAAPKLMTEAYRRGLTPVSMTEFWMGKSAGHVQEQMISSCPKCQSFMGFALCGLEQKQRDLAAAL